MSLGLDPFFQGFTAQPVVPVHDVRGQKVPTWSWGRVVRVPAAIRARLLQPCLDVVGTLPITGSEPRIVDALADLLVADLMRHPRC